LRQMGRPTCGERAILSHRAGGVNNGCRQVE
jgi:hypothetical protein